MKFTHVAKLMMMAFLASGIALQSCDLLTEREGCLDKRGELHGRDTVKNDPKGGNIAEDTLTTFVNTPIYYRTFTDSTGSMPGTRVTVTKAPAHGVLTPINANYAQGIFLYTPAFNYAGWDGFELRVCYPSGGCSLRKVNIRVIPRPVRDSLPPNDSIPTFVAK